MLLLRPNPLTSQFTEEDKPVKFPSSRSAANSIHNSIGDSLLCGMAQYALIFSCVCVCYISKIHSGILPAFTRAGQSTQDSNGKLRPGLHSCLLAGKETPYVTSEALLNQSHTMPLQGLNLSLLTLWPWCDPCPRPCPQLVYPLLSLTRDLLLEGQGFRALMALKASSEASTGLPLSVYTVCHISNSVHTLSEASNSLLLSVYTVRHNSNPMHTFVSSLSLLRVLI